MIRMKGAATTTNVLMLLIILMTIFMIYLAAFTGYQDNTILLNQESFELNRLKSTFSLFEKSLGMTWRLSTIQAIFQSGERGINCGVDDFRLLGGISTLDDGYWLQFNPAGDRSPADEERNGESRIPPPGKKYNQVGFNPQVCYPREVEVREDMRDVLNSKGFLALSSPTAQDTAGVTLTFGLQEPTTNFNINEDNVGYSFTQNAKAVFGKGTIQKDIASEGTIETQFGRMAAAARQAVDDLLAAGDGRTGRSNDLHSYVTMNPASKDDYVSNLESFVERTITTNSFASPNAQVAADATQSSAATNGVVPEGTGLVFHYDATVTYSEPAKYYFYNEQAGRFEKKQVKLVMKAKDYWPALDCRQTGTAVFNWQSQRDMMCCGEFLFFCGTSFGEFPDRQELGIDSSMEETSDPLDAQTRCFRSAGPVQCTSSGFVIS